MCVCVCVCVLSGKRERRGCRRKRQWALHGYMEGQVGGAGRRRRGEDRVERTGVGGTHQFSQGAKIEGVKRRVSKGDTSTTKPPPTPTLPHLQLPLSETKPKKNKKGKVFFFFFNSFFFYFLFRSFFLLLFSARPEWQHFHFQQTNAAAKRQPSPPTDASFRSARRPHGNACSDFSSSKVVITSCRGLPLESEI